MIPRSPSPEDLFDCSEVLRLHGENLDSDSRDALLEASRMVMSAGRSLAADAAAIEWRRSRLHDTEHAILAQATADHEDFVRRKAEDAAMLAGAPVDVRCRSHDFGECTCNGAGPFRVVDLESYGALKICINDGHCSDASCSAAEHYTWLRRGYVRLVPVSNVVRAIEAPAPKAGK